MRNVFEFRDQLIAEYASFSRSFTRFRAQDIARAVEAEYKKGRFWPEPLIQINPNYQRAKNVDELVAEGVETDAQRARLLELGCEIGQGYWFGKPVSAQEFAQAHLHMA